jgi:hypothetical protein
MRINESVHTHNNIFIFIGVSGLLGIIVITAAIGFRIVGSMTGKAYRREKFPFKFKLIHF